MNKNDFTFQIVFLLWWTRWKITPSAFQIEAHSISGERELRRLLISCYDPNERWTVVTDVSLAKLRFLTPVDHFQCLICMYVLCVEHKVNS